MNYDFSKHINLGKVKEKDEKISKIKKTSFFLSEYFSLLKARTVNRIFWGRSNYHNNIFLTLIIIFSSIITFTGVFRSFSNASSYNKDFINNEKIFLGQIDNLKQGSTIFANNVVNTNNLNIGTTVYNAKKGEFLSEIASKHGVSSDTIRWANSKNSALLLSNTIDTDTSLQIPSLNGIFYKVKSGQTLQKIIDELQKNNPEANEFNIVELNGLTKPYNLSGITELFIPGGNNSAPIISENIDIPKGVFIDPLSHPNCSGYTFQRGYIYNSDGSVYHNGVDLSRWPGCPIEAIANGIVTFAGWAKYGEGYMVSIDHGGGISSSYYHGDGTFWVKAGDRVSIGQEIMMMGSTGNSTGVHLHLILWKNGRSVDPAPFVPYSRPY